MSEKKETYDPTEGMTTGEKVLAGVGYAFVQSGRMVGNLVGVVSDADMAEAAKLDAPLLNTTAGYVGAGIGTTVLAVGAAAGAAAAVTAAGPTAVGATVTAGVRAGSLVKNGAMPAIGGYFLADGLDQAQKDLTAAEAAGVGLGGAYTDPKSPLFDPRIPEDATCRDSPFLNRTTDPWPSVTALGATAAFGVLANVGGGVPYVGPALRAGQWASTLAVAALVPPALTESLTREAQFTACEVGYASAKKEQEAFEQRQVARQQSLPPRGPN